MRQISSDEGRYELLKLETFIEGYLYILPVTIFFFSYCQIIVNRPRNGYETVGSIKVVCTDSFKQLEVANKVDYTIN